MERGMNLQLTTQEPSDPFRHLFDGLARCRPYIDAALNETGVGRATHTFEDIVEGVSKGLFRFWPGEQSCMITELITYPKRRGVHVFLAGGDLDEILEMEKDLTQWAKSIGADHMSLSGRAGWTRVLKDAGLYSFRFR